MSAAPAATAVRPRGVPRGGNRLPPERYPARGPAYDRSRAFGVDRERRDKHQRTRTRRAIALAQTRGELPPILAAVLYQLLDLCTDTLLCPAPDEAPACSGWWSRRFIHDLIYPPGTPIPEGDGPLGEDGASVDPTGFPHDMEDLSDEPGGSRFAGPGARTAGRWMAALVAAGWVQVVHRHKVINGEHWGTSNLWRFQIPDHLRAELHAAEDASRARRSTRRPSGARPPGKTTRAPHGAARDDRSAAATAVVARNDARRSHPCPTCEANQWVYPFGQDGGAVRCSACDGTGTTLHGP